MLVKFFVFTFVDAFMVIAAFGHVLLCLALWPVSPNDPHQPLVGNVGKLFAMCKGVSRHDKPRQWMVAE